jgi:hypothetical protein
LYTTGGFYGCTDEVARSLCGDRVEIARKNIIVGSAVNQVSFAIGGRDEVINTIKVNVTNECYRGERFFCAR